MFTYELTRRLEGTGVTAAALHPALARTSFSAEDPSRLPKVMIPLLRPFMKAPARGAATSIYPASAPEAEGVTSRHFANRKPKTSSEASHDTAAAARLWQISADLTGLNTRVSRGRRGRWLSGIGRGGSDALLRAGRARALMICGAAALSCCMS